MFVINSASILLPHVTMGRRLWNFKGTAGQYINALENAVTSHCPHCKLSLADLTTFAPPSTLPIFAPASTPTTFAPASTPTTFAPASTPTTFAPASTPTTFAPTHQKWLQSMPQDEEQWKDVQLPTLEVVHIFCLLTRKAGLSSVQLTDFGRKAILGDILTDYVAFTQATFHNLRLAKQLSNTSSLIFFALTRVAIKAGIALDVVNAWSMAFLTTQQGFSNAGIDYLSRLRTAVEWPLICMEELDRKGLEHRSYELFWCCMHCP
jgi:hypothetical protein